MDAVKPRDYIPVQSAARLTHFSVNKNRCPGDGEHYQNGHSNKRESGVAPADMPSSKIAESNKRSGRNECAQIGKPSKDIQSKTGGTRHITHQVSHAGYKRANDQHPTTQLVKPLLRT